MRAAWWSLSVAFVLAAPPALGASVSLTVSAHDAGAPDAHNDRPQWFEVEGVSGRDPPMLLSPGDVVRVGFENRGTHVHSFHASFGGATALLAPNESATLVFAVPANATTGAYWCDAHRVAGMSGPIDLGTGVVPPTVSESKLKLAGAPTLALALLACALLARARRRSR